MITRRPTAKYKKKENKKYPYKKRRELTIGTPMEKKLKKNQKGGNK